MPGRHPPEKCLQEKAARERSGEGKPQGFPIPLPKCHPINRDTMHSV